MIRIKIKRLILYFCIGILLLCGVLIFYFNAHSRKSEWAKELTNLHEINLYLLKYAEKHDGKFPDATFVKETNGLKVKALCVVINLPETIGDLHHPYLYFPGKSLEAHDSKEIIGASIETYFHPNLKMVRVIMFSDGTSELQKESDFLQFLNSGIP